MPERAVFGWDVGGAHVKACVLRGGEVVDAAQWACPLWQGMDRLDSVLHAAHRRWPGLGSADHAVTMTGEMVDLFASREVGVQRIAETLAAALADGSTQASKGSLRFFAGDDGWCTEADTSRHWPAIASANWLATARHCALHLGDGHGEGVLVDIGSTTTDLIAFRDGRVLTPSRTDAERLARAELVYHGVVRTPLCALAPRIVWRGLPHNVMNEFFATTADVYRLTGELAPDHDLHPSADGAPKDLPATRQRLARMIGLDGSDGSADEWLACAHAWRAAQVAELGGQLRRVIETQGLGARAVVVGAGCGDFLVRDVLAAATPGPQRLPVVAYGSDIARVAADRPTVRSWVQVAAPAVAVATLFDRDRR